MCPCAAAIRGFEHPAAERLGNFTVACETFTCTSVQNIRVGRVNDHGRHSHVGHKISQDVPCSAAIGGFPNAARHTASPHDIRIGGVDNDGAHTSADVARADPRPACAGDRLRIVSLLGAHFIDLLGSRKQAIRRDIAVLVAPGQSTILAGLFRMVRFLLIGLHMLHVRRQCLGHLSAHWAKPAPQTKRNGQKHEA